MEYHTVLIFPVYFFDYLLSCPFWLSILKWSCSNSCNPFSPLSPPHTPLAIVRLFLTSMSLVTFCLLFSSVDYVLVKGEIIWYLSLTIWLISFSNYYKGHMDKIKGRVEVGDGDGFSWGWMEGWGEKAYNCNRITIKIKKKEKQKNSVLKEC